MKICAIVLNYRKAEETGACLRSLIGQSVSTAVVVDNSADEQAASELERVLSELQEEQTDFSLHTITPSDNLGFSVGVNLACSSSHAEHCQAFLLINNDAIAESSMVQNLAEALRNEFLAVPRVVNLKKMAQPVFWYHRMSGLMTEARLPGAFKFPSGCCILFRKELLSQGRLFDEDFFMYGEDVLLGWQLSNHGRQDSLKTVENAVVYHGSKGIRETSNLFYEYHTARAHVLLSLKTWHSRFEVPLLLLVKSVGLASRATYRALRYRSLIPLLAFLLAWLPLSIQPHGKRPN